MRLGYYVRCPLYNETADYKYPRCFMLAQAKAYNEISEQYTVQPYDLLGSAQYYLDRRSMIYPKAILERCAGPAGARVKCSKGNGVILLHNEPQSDDDPYMYYIKLDSGEYCSISETELQIEYTQLDYSPLKQLKNYEFQNPSWYSNRIQVARNTNFLNNASYGFRTMAGCRAYLLPHQVSTVARCFELAPIRYMLADEVGLGKTIEACSIVKILTSDNRKLRVLFAVPGALVNQWRTELTYKYDYSRELKSGQARIVALEDILDEYLALRFGSWDVLVVDETHRLLKNQQLYRALLSISKSTENVLLLSATPIQDRNEEYHKLLTLLSPEQYEQMDRSRFSQLVRKQKTIQRRVNVILKRMDSFEDYEEDILEKVEEICESLDDPRLNKMLDALHKAEDKVSRVENILSYICENYRLERRVIRNRRAAITTKMAKRTLEEIHYLPRSSDDLYNESEAIEATMHYLSEQDEDDDYVYDVAQPLLSALFSSPWAFESTVKKLEIDDDGMVSCANRWKKQAEQELQQVHYLLDEEPDSICSRILRVVDYLEQETSICDKPEKVVVFTGFTETLKALKKALDARLERYGLYSVAFAADMSREDLENSVYDFQNVDECRVILCDETGGEGRNFQTAKMIIHVDLPWTANALEQRIGRLDRLGRSPEEDVHSVVIYSENTIEEQLFKIWRDGMKLFSHSLSGMEIITGELNNMIVEALQDDYYNGLTNALPDIMEIMEDMQDAVEEEQLFDVGATIYRPLGKAIQSMLNTYLEGEGELFARAMINWGHQAGLTPSTHKTDGPILFTKNSFSLRAALQSLFVPPDWKLYSNASIVQRTGMIQGTYSRKLAIERENLIFLAPSDPTYEAISSNAMGCSRGRCCAVEVSADFSYLGFVFTYIAQPDTQVLIEKGSSLRVLSQFRVFLPLKPITVCVPIHNACMDVPDQKVLEILNQPWKIRNGKHLGKRGSSEKGEAKLQDFMEQYPEDLWHNVVNYARRESLKKAKAILEETADRKAAHREINRLIAGKRAECAYFEKNADEVEEEIRAYQNAWEAIKTLRLELDSVCFMKVVNHG